MFLRHGHGEVVVKQKKKKREGSTDPDKLKLREVLGLKGERKTSFVSS